jgi:predicted CXXCH cytochrome family protein
MRRSAWALLFFLVIILLGSCEPRTRYKTLSFFFDGVPDPDKVVSAPRDSRRQTAERLALKRKFSSHGPYEAKMCDACHQRATNALVLPIEELCVKWHIMDIDKKYLHGPVAAGGCRVCHDPHGTGRPFLLVSDAQKFCYYCHDENAVSATEAHRDVEASCTECHDAHSADNRFFLK